MLPRIDLKRMNRAKRRAFVSSLKKFARKEDGSLIIFSVYLFVMMLIVVGWGIDLMHYERERAVLQSSLDRAVLAAADLDQTLPAEEVVKDYFTKSGLGDNVRVTVSQGVNFRDVHAQAEFAMRTQFMHMTGVDQLGGTAASRAEERVDSVEISMVLDVSGSMTGDKLPNLKNAATAFVDQMFDNTAGDTLSISVVPYDTSVAIPESLFDAMNTTREHDFSHCIKFKVNEFANTILDDNFTYEQSMHFDRTRTTDGRTQNPPLLLGELDRTKHVPSCEPRESQTTRILQNDRDKVKDFINNLVIRGWTSIDIGVRWGVTLLDPSVNQYVDEMIAAGDVPATFSDRPLPYGEENSLKVMILMTDGANKNQWRIRDGFRTGLSDVHYHAEDQIYTLHAPSEAPQSGYEYYQFHEGTGEDGRWADHPYGQSGPNQCFIDGRNEVCGEITYDGDPSVHLEYPDLYAYTSTRWYENKLLTPVYGSREAENIAHHNGSDMIAVQKGTAKDPLTLQACSLAKEQGVIIFTIAFETLEEDLPLMKSCASAPSNFYDVDGLEISEAFSSIASSIRKIRLIQ